MPLDPDSIGPVVDPSGQVFTLPQIVVRPNPLPGKLADGTDDPNDWISPGSDDGLPDDWIDPAAPANSYLGDTSPGLQTNATGAAPVGPQSRDPSVAYWSFIPAAQVGSLPWDAPTFPNAPGFSSRDANAGWPPPQLSGPNIPSGGILESLRYLSKQPGQTPYAGILEGLRKFGPPGLLEAPDYGWSQPFFAPQAPTSMPPAAADGRRPIGDYSAGEIARDTAKSFGVGTGRGVIGLLGLGGDLREAVGTGVRRAEDYLAPGYAPNIGATTSKYLASIPFIRALNLLFAGPTSSQIQNTVESFTGPFYQPKTIVGDYAQTGGEFLPSAMLAPEGSLATRALRYGFMPALSSETAGQLTQGTGVEPWARIAGAIVGGGTNAWRNLPFGPRGRLIWNVESGRMGEDAVGIPRNGPKPKIIISISGVARYPDRLTPSTIEEVKNREYLPFTAQIKDYLAHADENGLELILHVRPGIRYSAPMQSLIDAGRIIERPIQGLSR